MLGIPIEYCMRGWSSLSQDVFRSRHMSIKQRRMCLLRAIYRRGLLKEFVTGADPLIFNLCPPYALFARSPFPFSRTASIARHSHPHSHTHNSHSCIQSYLLSFLHSKKITTAPIISLAPISTLTLTLTVTLALTITQEYVQVVLS